MWPFNGIISVECRVKMVKQKVACWTWYSYCGRVFNYQQLSVHLRTNRNFLNDFEIAAILCLSHSSTLMCDSFWDALTFYRSICYSHEIREFAWYFLEISDIYSLLHAANSNGWCRRWHFWVQKGPGLRSAIRSQHFTFTGSLSLVLHICLPSLFCSLSGPELLCFTSLSYFDQDNLQVIQGHTPFKQLANRYWFVGLSPWPTSNEKCDMLM